MDEREISDLDVSMFVVRQAWGSDSYDYYFDDPSEIPSGQRFKGWVVIHFDEGVTLPKYFETWNEADAYASIMNDVLSRAALPEISELYCAADAQSRKYYGKILDRDGLLDPSTDRRHQYPEMFSLIKEYLTP